METPLTWLDDLSQDNKETDMMHVRVGVEQLHHNYSYINFIVRLSFMGLHWEDDFEFEFSKDLQRDMNLFYSEHGRIPSSEEYKILTERHFYPYLSAS